MTISQTQLVDILYKKLSGVSKTDTSTAKSPANEANASPQLTPGSTIWQQDYSIPNVSTLPTSNSSVVTVYSSSTSSVVQTAALSESVAQETWTTGLTNWISPQFGAGYQLKLYAGPPGASSAQAVNFTNLPVGGSGNSDSWYFDYIAGIVNFADTNVPTPVANVANVVYAVGARYTGTLGIGNYANLTVANLAITGNVTGNISTDNIFPNVATSTVFRANTAVGLPSGNTSARPAAAAGFIRFNTDTSVIEFYNGTSWVSVTNSITDQQITPDGVNQSFSLNQTTTAVGILVSINGTVQSPGVAYTVTGSTITFAEVPLSSDIVDIRYIATAVSTSLDFEIVDTANVQIGTTTAIIDSFSTAQYRSAKYLISSTTLSDSQFSEIILVQNSGTTAVNTIGNVRTAANTVTYSANVSGNIVNLLATSSTSPTQLRIQRTYFNI